MKTAEEKAFDLLQRFSILDEGQNHLVVECAIISVEEILYSDTPKEIKEYYTLVLEELKKYKNIFEATSSRKSVFKSLLIGKL